MLAPLTLNNSLTRDPNLLVGFDLADDAGVYRLSDDTALVQTVDVFTPVVDDAYSFGQIAAANALSDIYAMGARPLTALNIAAFPRQTLPFEILGEILRGGLDKVREAGATLLGGHTVENAEPLYGLAMTGLVHPQRIATNAGARPGDVLVLTKALGTGLISTAIKREVCPEEVADAAIASMSTLNRAAAEAMIALGIGAGRAVHACTDITGFGLMGHALEMARGSDVCLEIESSQLPLLPQVQQLAQNGLAPGGTGRNAQTGRDEVRLQSTLDAYWTDILWDPQTSGGLLIAIAPEHADALHHELQTRGALGWTIGHVRQSTQDSPAQSTLAVRIVVN
ncbi:MAG: selenide, water dikinase [Abditibacteriota bacterium]|nr:selenide, water dikinase [Abditibacteriota bacterium]